MVEPFGVHIRSRTSATDLPRARSRKAWKSSSICVGLADDVDLAQQGGGDVAQLGHVPVGADAPGVALEDARDARAMPPSRSSLVSLWLSPSVSR